MREHIHPDISLQAFQHSFRTYPRRWYEHNFLRSKALMLAITLPSFWLLVGLKILPNTALSMAGVAVYFSGLFLDVLSTAHVTRLKPSFDNLGLEFPLYEDAGTFPRQPTLKDIVTHWHFWFMVAAAPVIYIVPTGAFGMLIGRLCVSLSNFRQARRLELALKMLAHNVPSKPAYKARWREA